MTNLDCVTELTEFAPLTAETKQSTVHSLFSKLFKFNQDETTDSHNKEESVSNVCISDRTLENVPDEDKKITQAIQTVDQYSLNVEARTLPNVLRRVSSLLALRNKNSPTYKDTNLKQYWMPDSISKECYDCNEKFTTFRRKHHCRVCGQIFCSRCCNQEVPGKILGCSGDLRVCTYCCKVVLSYLQSADMEAELSADLRALQDDLQSKFGNEYTPTLEEDRLPVISSNSISGDGEFKRRKISYSYQEERFIFGRNSDASWNGQQLEGSGQVSTLNNLIEQIMHSEFRIQLQSFNYNDSTYDLCFLGSQLIDWLISQKKTSSRTHSLAICQVLLDAGYIENVGQKANVFIDGTAVYHFIVTNDNLMSLTAQKNEITSSAVTETKKNLNAADGGVFSQSVFHLDLNIHDNTAHISRMYKGNTKADKKKTFSGCDDFKIGGVLYEFLKQNLKLGQIFKTNWLVADYNSLSSINDTKRIYKLLTELFSQHIQNTIRQLLASEGLSLSWATTITALAERSIQQIKLDFTKIDIFDIRSYVQIKTIVDDKRENCCVIDGIVCTKNIAHRKMCNRLLNPRILLLQCAIVYQRIEGRLMSLEPVMLQEQEYLRHAVARIAALNPSLVLVQKNVSRIAQESLTQLGITLVLNVKYDVLERIARCTNADIVTSVDAYVGKPQLGMCAAFYTRNFLLKDGTSKTLMFFEGCALSHLGRTILLHGSSDAELTKLKSIINFVNLLIYNSNLEKSFLLDEFAKPFTSPQITFLSDVNSPDTDNNSNNNYDGARRVDNVCVQENTTSRGSIMPDSKKITEIIEEKRIISKSVVDENEDPLHVNFSRSEEESALTDIRLTEQAASDLALSEVKVSRNKFKEALQDTILSISPLIMFNVPYLETETGRNCELRKFFRPELYYSAQFSNMKNRLRNTICDVLKSHNNIVIEKQLHPFMKEKLKDSYDKEYIQELLASFRACGNRYIYRYCHNKRDAFVNVNTDFDDPEKQSEQRMVDVLDPRSHQHIYVLFCSFSPLSNNVPGFCVNPWVVNMDFYGQNDIPLGSFLTKYCFRESYVCPSKSCDTPMIDHERRFVHDNGCVHVTLHEVAAFQEKYVNQSILMWSYCTQCKISTPIVSMSDDTWGLSFAKYLELRFHGSKYVCRTVNKEECQHLLHRDFFQYFYYNNIIALFRYSTILLWKISFPPLMIKISSIKYNMDCVLDQIKKWSLMGHEVFSSILEKLHSMENDAISSPITLQGMKTHLTKQQAVFKQHVEEIQVVLSSLTSNADHNDAINKNNRLELFKLDDSIVLLKKSVAQILFNWNALLHKLDIKKPKPKSSLSTTQASEDVIVNVHDEVQKFKNPEESDICAEDCFEDTEKFWKRFTHIPFDDDNRIGTDGHSDNYNKCQKIDDEKDHKSIFYDDYNSDEITQEEDKPTTKDKMNNDHTLQPVPADPNETVITPVTQVSDKFTVKTILSQLFFNSNVNILPNPINSNEHYLLNVSGSIPIVVYENEPGSIIATALNSYHYLYSLENLQKQLSNTSDHSVVTRTSSGSGNKKDNAETSSRTESMQLSETEENIKTDTADDSKPRGNKLQDHMHIEISFSDSTANFNVRVYFAQQFAQLREMIFPSGEDEYIRSLCRCIQWAAHGGKSGSTFCKTKDDRFVLKQMSRLEIHSFLEFAQYYFNFISDCYTTNKPTLLAKIVGVYRVKYRTSSSSITTQSNLLVIENLFSGRHIARKFDLKGSVRNRLVDPDVIHEGELVLLDENLINMTCESPLYIYPYLKTVLMQAINSDVAFLASQSVMDYSLLVGLDETESELVVGIIDYIRTFTWDKKLETMVKKSGILGGQGKLPTIVSPEEYKNRFIAAMHKYFLCVPDQWYKCENDSD